MALVTLVIVQWLWICGFLLCGFLPALSYTHKKVNTLCTVSWKVLFREQWVNFPCEHCETTVTLSGPGALLSHSNQAITGQLSLSVLCNWFGIKFSLCQESGKPVSLNHTDSESVVSGDILKFSRRLNFVHHINVKAKLIYIQTSLKNYVLVYPESSSFILKLMNCVLTCNSWRHHTQSHWDKYTVHWESSAGQVENYMTPSHLETATGEQCQLIFLLSGVPNWKGCSVLWL